ncbi:hypothetical protein BDQ17DRAFT_1363769 [Cyathus striatus]|nr:hypothetical protein BDQ17DRAFT_1363769 [Cyathus striatus]
MSGGFMYQPVNLPPSVYLDNVYQQPQFSPFVPTGGFTSSPYSNPTSLPGTPHGLHSPLPAQGSPNTILFPAQGQIYAEPVWAVPVMPIGGRERRPSFNAPLASPTPTWLHSPPQRQRTISSGHNPYQYQPSGSHNYWPPPVGFQYPFSPVAPTPFTPGFSNLPAVSQQLFMHPWLNAEVPRDDFMFDLSQTAFNPLRIIGQGQVIPVAQEELVQPATHPPITALRIVCDAIPQWPIELQYNPQYYTGVNPPPISLGDVLGSIHSYLQKSITHVEWAGLSQSDMRSVNIAYSRRCRSAGSLDAVHREEVAGIKRVDFLMEKTRFRGLTRIPGAEGDIMTMKLIVA